MGLFDSLLGRTKVEKPTLERLFAKIGRAHV